MVYPALVRGCRQNILVTVYSQNNGEDGEPIVLLSRKLKCNYQSVAQAKYDEEHNKIYINAKALMDGDSFPELTEIVRGEVTISYQNGQKETRQIYKGYKARNPDGSVNYTCLELL